MNKYIKPHSGVKFQYTKIGTVFCIVSLITMVLGFYVTDCIIRTYRWMEQKLWYKK